MNNDYISFVLAMAEDKTVRLYEARSFVPGVYKGGLVEVDTPRGRQVGVILETCTERDDSDTARLIRAIADPSGDTPLRRVLATLYRSVIEYEDENDGEDDTAASDS